MEHELVIEARSYVERAMGGINTLNLGPLDYNVATTTDYLRQSAYLLEQYLTSVSKSGTIDMGEDKS